MAKRNTEDTAEYWIEKLQLTPHPGLETGYLNENFRDDHKVIAANGKERSGATNIYFLHKPGKLTLNNFDALTIIIMHLQIFSVFYFYSSVHFALCETG